MNLENINADFGGHSHFGSVSYNDFSLSRDLAKSRDQRIM